MNNSFSSFIRQRPGVSGAAAVVLASGIIFTINAATNNNTVTHQVKTSDGRSVLIQTGSGGQTGSGDLTVADQKTGSGRIKCAGTDGCGVVLNDADGTGCWALEVNNGTLITHGVPAAECP